MRPLYLDGAATRCASATSIARRIKPCQSMGASQTDEAYQGAVRFGDSSQSFTKRGERRAQAMLVYGWHRHNISSDFRQIIDYGITSTTVDFTPDWLGWDYDRRFTCVLRRTLTLLVMCFTPNWVGWDRDRRFNCVSHQTLTLLSPLFTRMHFSSVSGRSHARRPRKAPSEPTGTFGRACTHQCAMTKRGQ